jgi:Ca-activated chloride channel family protein
MTTFAMTSPTPAPSTDAAAESRGARLVSADGRPLLLERSRLETTARGGVARTIVEQTFVNPYDVPLDVEYLLPLPADGAVAGFAFRIGATRVVGEIDKKKEARARYTRALAEGRTAALLEQERSSLFTQSVGNVPPRERVVCEVSVDQKLTWLDERQGAGAGGWEWRFPTVVGPRYMGAAGRVPDAARLVVDVADAPLAERLELALEIGDALAGSVEGASHALRVERVDGATHVALAAGARLDRDVVVRWPVARPDVGVGLALARPSREALAAHTYGLLTITPPARSAATPLVARDLIVLIDTSGSMDGAPLTQAKRVTSSLIDGLRPQDRLELVEFSSFPRRWRSEPIVASREGKQSALAWVRGLQAGGSTEMHAAIVEALAPLRPGVQRQVVVITDGYIGFEDEVVGAVIRGLPSACRVHCVGVGSSVNRSLSQPLARCGGGVELVLGLGDDPDRLAARLLARTADPVVTQLVLEGAGLTGLAPMRLPDLFAGTPALVSFRHAAAGGTLTLRGVQAGGAPFVQTVHVPKLLAGEGEQAVVQLFGREWIEDLEARRLVSGMTAEADAEIERVGLEHQLSTRHTAWIAVSDAITVDPSKRGRQARVEHELAHGLSAEGLGLRASSGSADDEGQEYWAGAPPALGRAAPVGDEMTGRARGPAAGGPVGRPAPATRPPSASWVLPKGQLERRASDAPEDDDDLFGEPLERGAAMFDDAVATGDLPVQAKAQSWAAPPPAAAPRPTGAPSTIVAPSVLAARQEAADDEAPAKEAKAEARPASPLPTSSREAAPRAALPEGAWRAPSEPSEAAPQADRRAPSVPSGAAPQASRLWALLRALLRFFGAILFLIVASAIVVGVISWLARY